MSFVLRHWRILAGAFVALAAVILFVLLYQEASTGAVDLMDAGVDDLRQYLLHRRSILYCPRETEEPVPQVFSDLQKLIGNEYEFAILDCDRKLPSGKTLWEKYNLNKKMNPVIFGVAPWAKSVQASHSSMKTAASLRVLFENKLAVKANIITSTADLIKACGWTQKTRIEEDRNLPCIAVAKGGRFNEDDAKTLQIAIKTFPKARFVSFAAKDRRLSVEDAGSYIPSRFGAKYYALQNDTRYIIMTESPTEDKVLDFVSSAVTMSMSNFLQSSSPTALIKYTADRIKDFDTDKAGAKKKSHRKKHEGAGRSSAEADSFESSSKHFADDANTDAKERHKREADVREKMLEEERGFLFDVEADVEDSDAAIDEEQAEEYEGDIIEL